MSELRNDHHDVRSVERSADLWQPEQAHDQADRDGEDQVSIVRRVVYPLALLILASIWLGAYLAYITYREIDEEPELQPLLGVVRGQPNFPRVLR